MDFYHLFLSQRNNQSFEMNEFFDMNNEEFDDERDENKRFENSLKHIN